MNRGELILIPTLLGSGEPAQHLSLQVLEAVCTLKYFVVEELRTARRYLKQVNRNINIDEITFFVLNEHTQEFAFDDFLGPINRGENVGLMSEAGLPALADPGASLISLAHRNNIRVRPLSGPSSIALALCASGMNGQNFAFNGYLPVNRMERVKKLLQLEKCSFDNRQCQIFIETPYRNMHVFEDIIAHLKPSTKICVASNITHNDEFIQTKSVVEWKKFEIDLNKKPTVFIIEA